MTWATDGPRRKPKARAEANTGEKRMYAKQFAEAKALEIKSWKDNNVYEWVKLSNERPSNYVTGRWVLTIKRKPDGTFDKCKARWVLRGFQDQQKWDQQTDSPTASRPAFRMTCQLCATRKWSFHHVDLKTAFLQGEEYDKTRDVYANYLQKQLGVIVGQQGLRSPRMA